MRKLSGKLENNLCPLSIELMINVQCVTNFLSTFIYSYIESMEGRLLKFLSKSWGMCVKCDLCVVMHVCCMCCMCVYQTLFGIRGLTLIWQRAGCCRMKAHYHPCLLSRIFNVISRDYKPTALHWQKISRDYV